MTREITYTIKQDEWTAGRRATAGEFLRRRGFSRHLLTYLRHHNNTLLLNNEAIFTNHPVFPGDTLTVIFTDEIPAETVVPTPMDLNIGVVSYYQSQGIPFIYRCVNRLDRNTSGLVIVAKNMASSAILYEEMKERRIRRTYFTVVHGRFDTPEGTIDLPIARKTPSLMERCVDPENGQRAVTHYTQLSRQEKNDATALSVRLETGRTHQIRVHMSYIGHPVVGDSLYGVPSGDLISRQALHSLKLEFMHPISRKDLTFEAPLPEDIRSLLF